MWGRDACISQEGLKRALPLPALARVFSLGRGWKLERGMQAGAVSIRPWVRPWCPSGGIKGQRPSGSINQNLAWENTASQQGEGEDLGAGWRGSF